MPIAPGYTKGDFIAKDGYKLCSRCKTRKPVKDFHKNCGTPDEYNYTCKVCRIGHTQGRKPYQKRCDTEQVKKWYLVEKKSLTWIGNQLNTSSQTVSKWLSRAGIKLRDFKEQSRIELRRIRGMIKPLKELIRYCGRGKDWQAALLEKYGHKCVGCGTTENLQCHHIKPMHSLLQDFLKLHPDLDSDKDRILLSDLAKTHDEFFDINNGNVLCWNCHLKEHNFNFNNIRS